MIASKFEPTFARQAFPCFDEPAFKTPFDIEIAKPSGNEFIALSNMDQEVSYYFCYGYIFISKICVFQ